MSATLVETTTKRYFYFIGITTGNECIFYPSRIPVNYTICFKKAILSKVKNRFNQDNYSKTYNQISFLLYVIFLKLVIYVILIEAQCYFLRTHEI